MRLASILLSALAVMFAGAAPAAHPSACGPAKTSGGRFTIACQAQDNSHLAVILSGPAAKDPGAFDKIVVFRNGAKLQEIAVQGQFWATDDRLVDFQDINFDGFDDIRVMTSTSAGPNVGFDYWLYNPRSGKYEHSDIGDALSGFDVMPDARTKTITVTGRSSCCEWETASYKWVGPKLRIKSLRSTGIFSVADTPPLEQDSPQFCGAETKHFDDDGGLVSVDYERTGKDDCTGADDAETLVGLLQLFRKKQNGYAIVAGSSERFTIRYATPLPGHDSL